jgi:hypothetical protein
LKPGVAIAEEIDADWLAPSVNNQVKRATYTYCKLMGLLVVATFLSALLIGPGVLTAIGTVLLILGGRGWW